MSFPSYLAEQGRLRILKLLGEEADGTLNSALLEEYLRLHGFNRSRAWLHTQLRALEDVGGVKLRELDDVLVATITRSGRDHVERRGRLDGVARPDDPG